MWLAGGKPRGLSAVFGALLVCVGAGPASASPAAQYEFSRGVRSFTDGRIEAVDQATRFDCSERIYAIVHLSGMLPGKLSLRERWFDPSGRVVSDKDKSFNVGEGRHEVYLSSFVALEGDSGLMAGLFDPAAGYVEFIGQWRVELRSDSRLLGAGEFEVIC